MSFDNFPGTAIIATLNSIHTGSLSIYYENCDVLIENSPFMAPTRCKSCNIFRLVMASHADLVNLTVSLPLSLY